MKYDAFIFDIDGVLIDTTHSFSLAVVQAVSHETKSDRFTVREVAMLKALGGFNNDWHVAIAGVSWLRYYAHLSFFESFTDLLEKEGSGLTSIKKLCPKLSQDEIQKITRLSQEAYGGTTACRKLYGFEPIYLKIPGYWQKEKSLIDPKLVGFRDSSNLMFGKRVGIVTGRDRGEVELALEILKWKIPENQMAYSDVHELDKPNPFKLIQIVENLNSEKPLFFGDTKDDIQLVQNYRLTTGKPITYCHIRSVQFLNHNLQGYDFALDSVNEFFYQEGRQNDYNQKKNT